MKGHVSTAWHGFVLLLVAACTMGPALASTYTWTIFDLNGVSQEQFTFTTSLNQVWPDAASEVHFADSTEWPVCGFFFADQRHFDCSIDLTDQNVMNLSVPVGDTWQLGMNALFDGSIRENQIDTDTNNGFQSLSVLIALSQSPHQPDTAPEPASLMMSVAGLVLISLLIKRRKGVTLN